MREDDLIRTNVDFLLTETVLDTTIPAADVIAVLRRRKTTGHVTIHLSQGGIQKIVLSEKTRATDIQSEKIREVLRMNGNGG